MNVYFSCAVMLETPQILLSTVALQFMVNAYQIKHISGLWGRMDILLIHTYQAETGSVHNAFSQNLPEAIWILQPDSSWILEICSPPFPMTMEEGGEKMPVLNLFEFRQGSQAVTQKLSRTSILMITCQTLILTIMNWRATYWIPPSYQALWSLLSQEPWKRLGHDQ